MSSWVITEEAKLKKAAGRAGWDHMSGAARVAGNPQEVPAVGEAGGQAVSPSLALRGNYALLMVASIVQPEHRQMYMAPKHAAGNS